MLLYNGFDTLVFSTTDFYISNPDYFYEQKEAAGLTPEKEYPFEYAFKGRGIVDSYKNNEKVTSHYDIEDSSCFVMRSKSFNPFAWSFTDPESNFQFSAVFSETKKVFQVRILSKAFLVKSYHELIEDLQKILSVFGIDVNQMKVKRIDWATDISYKYKKMQKIVRDGYWLKAFFSRYGSLRAPVKTSPYVEDFGNGPYVTGIMTGTKAVKFRVYDKVLEAIEKYKDDMVKSQIFLDCYYPKSEFVVAPEIDDSPTSRYHMDLDLYLDCLKRDYIKDKFQVVRFEYQFRDTYLDRKFRFVSDLEDLEKVKSMVYTAFQEHTGIMPEYLDRDFKKYVAAIRTSDNFYNKYEKTIANIQGRILNAVKRIGSGLSSLGIVLSEKYGEVVPFANVSQTLDFFKENFFVNHYEKMYANCKVIFSSKGIKEKIMHYGEFSGALEEYQLSIL